MKLVIGLGNPEEKQKNNRHNVGFMAVDKMAGKLPGEEWVSVKKFQSLIIQNHKHILVKPQTYMNTSGKAVSLLVNHYKSDVSDVWVIHDDLDIILGEYKIQKGKGPRLHNGVNSIEESLGSSDFWRVRVGVENREKEGRIPGEAYVLQNFSQEEIEILMPTIDKMNKEILERIK